MKIKINGQEIETPFTLSGTIEDLNWLAKRIGNSPLSPFDGYEHMVMFVKDDKDYELEQARNQKAREDWILNEAERIRKERNKTGFGK